MTVCSSFEKLEPASACQRVRTEAAMCSLYFAINSSLVFIRCCQVAEDHLEDDSADMVREGEPFRHTGAESSKRNDCGEGISLAIPFLYNTMVTRRKVCTYVWLWTDLPVARSLLMRRLASFQPVRYLA